mgnify:CR=1 FL=1
MTLDELTNLATEAIDDLKGRDMRQLEVADLTSVTDRMLLVTGTSNRHVKSIANAVIMASKQAGRRPLGVEGLDQAEWVLVDLGDVVVHVMTAQSRAFYQLEKLWSAPADQSTSNDDATAAH